MTPEEHYAEIARLRNEKATLDAEIDRHYHELIDQALHKADPRLLSIREAAGELNISTATVYRRIKVGKYTKDGGKVVAESLRPR